MTLIPMSPNSASRDDQIADVVTQLSISPTWHKLMQGVFLNGFPEYNRLTWSGARMDAEASGVDPDYMSWVVDWVESYTSVTWEDGQPFYDSSIPYSEVLWVCDNCMFAHANGVDLRYESMHGMDYDPETNPSPEPEPWGIWVGANWRPAMGLLRELHECELKDLGPEDSDPVNHECDCGTKSFSRSSCDGCGATDDGERSAFAMFASLN